MAGYSPVELDEIQSRWNLRFPPDLIELMITRRPLMPGGFDWITTPAEKIGEMMRWPYESFLFDVENSDVWWPSWGQRPEAESERASRLAEVMAAAPKLIPLFGHRYLPETPFESGNPVFSVYQTDVICYGVDLADWIVCEEQGWRAGKGDKPGTVLKSIPFWSEALDDAL